MMARVPCRTKLRRQRHRRIERRSSWRSQSTPRSSASSPEDRRRRIVRRSRLSIEAAKVSAGDKRFGGLLGCVLLHQNFSGVFGVAIKVQINCVVCLVGAADSNRRACGHAWFSSVRFVGRCQFNFSTRSGGMESISDRPPSQSTSTCVQSPRGYTPTTVPMVPAANRVGVVGHRNQSNAVARLELHLHCLLFLRSHCFKNRSYNHT